MDEQLHDDVVEALEKRLKDQAHSFCEAHQREVDRGNAYRTQLEAVMRSVDEAHDILIAAMLGKDPDRRTLMRVLERLQRARRDSK